MKCPGCGLELQSGELVDVRNCGIFGECADCPGCGRRFVRNLLWRCTQRTKNRRRVRLVVVKAPGALGFAGHCTRYNRLVICDELFCCTHKTDPRCRAEKAKAA